MVTYCVKKMITTCPPMIGQFFDIMTNQHLSAENYFEPSYESDYSASRLEEN